jgi:hypothetical protein
MIATIFPFIKFGFKIIRWYFYISLFFICYFSAQFLVGLATVSSGKLVYAGEMAPVAFANPFLPYRDVTPRLLNKGLHDPAGIDYLTPEGTPLFAPQICPCVVTAVGFDHYSSSSCYKDNDGKDSNGNSFVRFESDSGEYSILYMHGDYSVVPGDIIAPGVQIGTESSIGCSSEPHSHIQVLKNGQVVDPRDHNNTAFLVSTGTKTVSHTGKSGNHGSVLSNYDNVSIAVSHYTPIINGLPVNDGVQCDSDCETMASGQKTRDWLLGIDGVYAAACPQEWPFGTRLRINNITFECQDRGGWINCYDIGDYDPAKKEVSTVRHCWIDALSESFGYTYGELVPPNEWGFITQ